MLLATVFLHFIGNSFFHWPMWLSIDSLLKINHRYHGCLPNKKLSICSMGLEYLPTMDRQILQSHGAFGLAVAAQEIGVLELWTFFSFAKAPLWKSHPWFPMKRRGTCGSYPGICLKRYWLVCKKWWFQWFFQLLLPLISGRFTILIQFVSDLRPGGGFQDLFIPISGEMNQID